MVKQLMSWVSVTVQPRRNGLPSKKIEFCTAGEIGELLERIMSTVKTPLLPIFSESKREISPSPSTPCRRRLTQERSRRNNYADRHPSAKRQRTRSWERSPSSEKEKKTVKSRIELPMMARLGLLSHSSPDYQSPRPSTSRAEKIEDQKTVILMTEGNHGSLKEKEKPTQKPPQEKKS